MTPVAWALAAVLAITVVLWASESTSKTDTIRNLRTQLARQTERADTAIYMAAKAERQRDDDRRKRWLA